MLMSRWLLVVLLMGSGCPSAWAETSVFSWNVWFDDDSGQQGRYQHILTFIQQQHPQVVCLQEVTPLFYQQLKQHFLGQYTLANDGLQRKSYGTVIMTPYGSPSTAEVLPLESSLGRTLLVVASADYTIINTHLESGLWPWDRQLRQRQLQQLMSYAQKHAKPIVCGDFNFGDQDTEQQGLRAYWDVGQQQAAPTYDIEHNVLAQHHKSWFEYSRRLDRIVLPRATQVKQYQRWTVPYSDHYPIMVQIAN